MEGSFRQWRRERVFSGAKNCTACHQAQPQRLRIH